MSAAGQQEDVPDNVKKAFEPVAKFETGIPKDRIGVSPQAIAAIHAALQKRGTPDSALRVGIKGGGCSGFSYVIEYADDAPRKGDTVYELEVEGDPSGAKVKVFCDRKSILYLGGSVLDYEKTLMYRGFKFKNPQEASRCGCGHSFTVG